MRSPYKDAILDFARQANTGANLVKQATVDAVKAAHKCGQLLILEKAWIDETRAKAKEQVKLAKNNEQAPDPQMTFWQDLDWPTYYDANFAKEITREQADRFVHLAKTHEGQGTFEFLKAPNVMRSGLLALQVFPPKQHEPVPNDVRLPPLASHFQVVHRFAIWLDGWRRKHGPTLSANERGRLLADFAPVAQFIDALRDPSRQP